MLESFRSVTAEVDEVKLTLALSNLIENAIKYNRDDGWVKVTLNADHKFFYVRQILELVFLRRRRRRCLISFYRVDKGAFQRNWWHRAWAFHYKNVILMHNGQIKFYSKENEGTTFTVRIPLTYIIG